MKAKVGFIGLGEMGKWMALNVAKAGFPLIVFDINPDIVRLLHDNGATAADSLTAVAENAGCILLSLPDTDVVESVIYGEHGLINRLRSGSILVDLSTINYTNTIKIAKELDSRGIAFIDAPVSGQEARAKDGSLTIMVGGDPEAIAKVRPILDAIGNNVILMGKSGNGQLAKLVNQLLYNISCAAMAEILPMAVKLGLDPESVCRVVTTGTGQTFALSFFTPYILKNDFRSGYPLIKAYKDMISAAEISSREKIPLPVFHAALHTYQLALLEGYGMENKGAMIKVWEKALGVKVRQMGFR
jgi:3-hydroxyisobutyrate dehydrogenase-like beta-hydroxyacid dehydrogenase